MRRCVMKSRYVRLMMLFLIAGLSGCGLLPSGSDQPATTAVALHIPPEPALPLKRTPDRQVDYVVVQKRDRIVTLWKGGRILKTYPIMAMGENPVGHKVYEGDERTPEGEYVINDKHISQNFQKFLGISYPNDKDKLIARRFGLSPGGQVGIHGDRGGMSGFFQRFDQNWTDGCIAMRNPDIEEVYTMVDVGTPILIRP